MAPSKLSWMSFSKVGMENARDSSKNLSRKAWSHTNFLSLSLLKRKKIAYVGYLNYLNYNYPISLFRYADCNMVTIKWLSASNAFEIVSCGSKQFHYTRSRHDFQMTSNTNLEYFPSRIKSNFLDYCSHFYNNENDLLLIKT